ncbi:hypothetical protein RJJ65_32060 [Rhizobium hidalgonense]|uniref:Uncharacterized protein n=1 Tax=Rhizobium hidalgonense TaxID=1538159 RepID=A0AAJ2H3K3_9HYPH|nr:hypothetical protein [Rhizobium hidalgonense]MDR9777193.1 hypothetical protein [Rhizobium hidalgonense]
MPRNGSGTSSVINTFVIDTVADPDEVNANFNDVADQLTNSLPRDGQAGMNAPLPLQNGTAALPALTFSSDENTGIYRKAADSVGVSGNGLEIAYFNSTGLFVNGAQVTGTVYASKSGSYTALASDNGAIHRYTAAATASLTAAATLGSGWNYTIIADGVTVTIDPNGSETVGGATTLIVPANSTVKIICDGSNFHISQKQNVWETIETRVVSATTSIDFTNLSAFRTLKVSGVLTSTSAGAFVMRTSTNNGSSYDAGASDYVQQVGILTNATYTGASSTPSSMQISHGAVDANQAWSFDMIIQNFNAAASTMADVKGHGTAGATITKADIGGGRIAATACNALRIMHTVGNIAGPIIIEGIRG